MSGAANDTVEVVVIGLGWIFTFELRTWFMLTPVPFIAVMTLDMPLVAILGVRMIVLLAPSIRVQTVCVAVDCIASGRVTDKETGATVVEVANSAVEPRLSSEMNEAKSSSITSKDGMSIVDSGLMI